MSKDASFLGYLRLIVRPLHRFCFLFCRGRGLVTVVRVVSVHGHVRSGRAHALTCLQQSPPIAWREGLRGRGCADHTLLQYPTMPQ